MAQSSVLNRATTFGRLTKFLRLTVYSFFTLDETMEKLTLLGKTERNELLNSQIARGKKKFKLKICEDNRPLNLLQGERMN